MQLRNVDILCVLATSTTLIHNIAVADDFSALTGDSGKSWRYEEVIVDGVPSDLTRHAEKRHIYYPNGTLILETPGEAHNEGYWNDEGDGVLNVSDGAYLIVDYHIEALTEDTFQYSYDYQGHHVSEVLSPSGDEVESEFDFDDEEFSVDGDVSADDILDQYEQKVSEFLSALEAGASDVNELNRANELRIETSRLESQLDALSLSDEQTSRRAAIGDGMVTGMMSALEP